MKSKVCCGVLTSLLVLTAVPTFVSAQQGEGCMPGEGLSATLLIPYFEVELGNASGVTTIISVNNGVASGVLSRMVVWSDWGVPVTAFDMYLGGFDVVPINMRDVLAGTVPSTGAGADLSAFRGCAAAPPTYGNPIGNADEIAQLRADLTGVEGPLYPNCVGQAFGDGIARGYVTVDAVNECSGAEPVEPGVTPIEDDYFVAGGTGVGGNANVLWGDVIYIDPANASAQGSEAIGVWANAFKLNTAGTHTFYGRFHDWDARDGRVPLPSLWDQRFFNGGPFAGGSDLIAYRDPGQPPVFSTVCGGSPDYVPVEAGLFALDEDGGSITDVSSSEALGLVTQRAAIDDFSIPFAFGWIQVASDFGSWVQPTLKAGGLFSASFNGMPVEFLCNDEVAAPMRAAAASRPSRPSTEALVGRRGPRKTP